MGRLPFECCWPQPSEKQLYQFFVFPLAAALILARRGKERDTDLHSHYFDENAYQVDMEPTHPAINTLLTGVGWTESQVLKVVNLPIGTGLVAVGRKAVPGVGEG